jgi:hypothetical protein
MFLSKKTINIPPGDYVTAEEAVMDKESDIQSRCEAIDEVVKDKVFTLSEALNAYEVTPEQYIGYLMMHGQSGYKRKIVADTVIIFSIVDFMFRIMDFSNAKLDPHTQKMVNNMRQLTGIK